MWLLLILQLDSPWKITQREISQSHMSSWVPLGSSLPKMVEWKIHKLANLPKHSLQSMQLGAQSTSIACYEFCNDVCPIASLYLSIISRATSNALAMLKSTNFHPCVILPVWFVISLLFFHWQDVFPDQQLWVSCLAYHLSIYQYKWMSLLQKALLVSYTISTVQHSVHKRPAWMKYKYKNSWVIGNKALFITKEALPRYGDYINPPCTTLEGSSAGVPFIQKMLINYGIRWETHTALPLSLNVDDLWTLFFKEDPSLKETKILRLTPSCAMNMR